MKKLLFVTALLALGTTAFAVNPTDTQDVKAEVLVKAQIVDDLLKITDIDGNPLVLDFKKVPKRDYSTGEMVKAHVEYKITATDKAETNPIKLNMSFTSFDSPEDSTALNTVEIVNEDITGAATENDKIKVNLALDADKKEIAVGQSTAVGQINGTINTDLSQKNKGLYTGKVFLFADVQAN